MSVVSVSVIGEWPPVDDPRERIVSITEVVDETVHVLAGLAALGAGLGHQAALPPAAGG